VGNKEDREIQKTAGTLINQVAIILKTSLIHDPGNMAVRTAVEKFIVMMNELVETQGSLMLELIGEFFYINGTRVRYSLEYLLNFDFLLKEFRKREIGTVTFRDIIRPEDVQIFLKAFVSSGMSDTPHETMVSEMTTSGYITIDKLKKVREERLKETGESEEVDAKKIIKKTYFNAVSYAKGVMTKMRLGEKVDVRKAKRIIETMVDQLMVEEQLILGMTAVKDYDDYTYHHMVNVSILSVAIGHKLGLGRHALIELGLAALFHDIGKIEIPYEVLNKPSSFTEEEWRIMRKHPLWSVKAILNLARFGSSTFRSVIVAFEHHLNCDFSGYPTVRHYTELDLYSRIVSLADQYDAMTSTRVYKRIPLSPDKTLSVMMETVGSQLDPLLFKYFVNIVGVYPIGTIVMLNTGEVGLVYEGNAALADRPRVMIIVDRQGKKAHGPVVNLAEKDATGRHLRSIVKTLDPNKYRVNLAEYLL